MLSCKARNGQVLPPSANGSEAASEQDGPQVAQMQRSSRSFPAVGSSQGRALRDLRSPYRPAGRARDARLGWRNRQPIGTAGHQRRDAVAGHRARAGAR